MSTLKNLMHSCDMTLNLTSLSTFICVTKHNSFTLAAKELFLTQGAVSSQIKQLENELGFQLFHRQVRKIYLTEDGKELLEVARPALNDIQLRIKFIRSKQMGGQVLTVSALNAFTSKWLVPRVLDFKALQPEIDLRIYTSPGHVDFVSERVDCAIRFGAGDYPGLSVTHLSDDIYFAVCSPGLIRKDHPLEKSEDIKHYQLLHDEITSEHSVISWEDWAKREKVTGLDMDRGLRYEGPHLVVQAALAKQGIALTCFSIVVDDIRSGLLVPLFKKAYGTRYSNYFVCPQEFEKNEKVRVFREWLRETLQKERADAEDCFVGFNLL